MKTSAVVVSGIAALALIGGSTAYALSSTAPEPTETPAAVSTESPAPAASAEPTPEPSAEPTPEPTVAAPTPTPTYTEAEALFIERVHPEVLYDGIEITADETLALGWQVCAELATGTRLEEILIPSFPADHTVIQAILRGKAQELLCP